MYECIWNHNVCWGQKRVFDPLELQLHGCQLPCGCWELNLDLLQEQQVLFTTEQLFNNLFFMMCVFVPVGSWVHVYHMHVQGRPILIHWNKVPFYVRDSLLREKVACKIQSWGREMAQWVKVLGQPDNLSSVSASHWRSRHLKVCTCTQQFVI